MKRLVMIGGGHTHSLVLHRMIREPIHGLSTVLISESNETPYSGMLTGYIAGFYSRADLFIDLELICRRAKAQLLQGRVVGCDLNHKIVKLATGEEISYDLLSINCGARPELGMIPGALEFGHPIKPVAFYQSEISRFIEQAPENLIPKRFVQVGAGAAGCEIAACVSGRLAKEGAEFRIEIVEAGPRLLSEAPIKTSRFFEDLFRDLGAKIHLRARLESVASDHVILDSGERIESDFTSLALPSRPDSWLKESTLETNADGFVLIDAHLKTSNEFVFATGDVALNPSHPLPRAGVFAVRQAPVLYENFKAVLHGAILQAFVPQKRWLSLMIDGRGAATGFWGEFSIPHSRLAWLWKDQIDRSFMRQFH